MSHHLFLLSPSDTPLYELTHFSSKTVQTTATSPLAANLPSWSTSAFAGTLTALSGASSAAQTHNAQGPVRVGGGKDRHVIQMIANASLDAIEEVMRKENVMCVDAVYSSLFILISAASGILSLWTSSTNGLYLHLLHQEVRRHALDCVVDIAILISGIDMKFILLHETRNDDGIKSFFNDVWELYVKVRKWQVTLRALIIIREQTMLNPFHTAHTPIRSAVFDGRVRASAKKYL